MRTPVILTTCLSTALLAAALLAPAAHAAPYTGDTQARAAANAIGTVLQGDSLMSQKVLKKGYTISAAALADIRAQVGRTVILEGVKSGRLTGSSLSVTADKFRCTLAFSKQAGGTGTLACKAAK